MQQVTGREPVDIITMQIHRLLEFACNNEFLLANTYGPYKYPNDGLGTAQMANNKIKLITSWLESASEPV